MDSIINLIKLIAELILKLFKKRRRDLTAFIDGITIDRIASEIVNEDYNLNIDSFLLFKVHNGGTKLKPHDFMYRSIVTGDYKSAWMPNFKYDEFRNLIIDHEYRVLMEAIREYKEYGVAFNELRPGSMRTTFEYQKIKFAKYFLISVKKEAMWYVVITTGYDEERFDTYKQKQKISVAINDIKNIIRKY